MPLGILTEEQLESELNSVTVTNIIRPTNGRNKGDNNIPEPIRKVAASLALEGAPHKEIQEMLGISQSSISAYQTGKTSTSSDKPDDELKSFVSKKRDSIVRESLGKIDDVLGSISSEDITKAKLRDKAAVAKDLSVVIKNMTPEVEDKPDINFNLFIPRQRTESELGEVIDISANEE